MKEAINYKTPILRYDMKEGKWKTHKDYDLLQNFRFANREFYLTYNKGVYYICTDLGNDIASVYFKKENDGGDKILPGEVAALFRKEYAKRGISQEMIELFLQNPQEYNEKFKK